MSVMSVIVGWCQNVLNDTDEVEVVDEISLSQQGYQFEHEEMKRMMERFKGFATVKFTDVKGYPLSPERIDRRYGPDGGGLIVLFTLQPRQNVVRVRLPLA